MDFHSAHTCTLQSIIHDVSSVQKETVVMSAGGCHTDNEPGHREVPEETRTSSPCPVTARILLVNPKVPKIGPRICCFEGPRTWKIQNTKSGRIAWKEVDQQYPGVFWWL
jgi:hypothetical protein